VANQSASQTRSAGHEHWQWLLGRLGGTGRTICGEQPGPDVVAIKHMRPIDLPEPNELLLLRALVAEPTQNAVAQRLGCSTRHLRRRLHSLMARLDVSTSHAAVVIAVLRGWLTEQDLKPFLWRIEGSPVSKEPTA